MTADYTEAELNLVFDWLRARTLDIRDAPTLPLFIATGMIRAWAAKHGRDREAWPNQRAVKALLIQAGCTASSVSRPGGRRWGFRGLEVLPDDAPDITE